MNNTEYVPNQDPKQLVDAWLRLWNGDYAGAEALIAPAFRLHAAIMAGGRLTEHWVNSDTLQLLTQLQAIA